MVKIVAGGLCAVLLVERGGGGQQIIQWITPHAFPDTVFKHETLDTATFK